MLNKKKQVLEYESESEKSKKALSLISTGKDERIPPLFRSVLEETEEMPEEGLRLRKDLKQCFQDISCFLLPYPGELDCHFWLSSLIHIFSGRGVTNPAFTGSIAELDSEFVTHVRH